MSEKYIICDSQLQELLNQRKVNNRQLHTTGNHTKQPSGVNQIAARKFWDVSKYL